MKYFLGLLFIFGFLGSSGLAQACEVQPQRFIPQKCFFDTEVEAEGVKKKSSQLTLFVNVIDIIPISSYRIDKHKNEGEINKETGVLVVSEILSGSNIKYIVVNGDPVGCYVPTIPKNKIGYIVVEPREETPKSLIGQKYYNLKHNTLLSRGIDILNTYAEKYKIANAPIYQLVCRPYYSDTDTLDFMP